MTVSLAELQALHRRHLLAQYADPKYGLHPIGAVNPPRDCLCRNCKAEQPAIEVEYRVLEAS